MLLLLQGDKVGEHCQDGGDSAPGCFVGAPVSTSQQGHGEDALTSHRAAANSGRKASSDGGVDGSHAGPRMARLLKMGRDSSEPLVLKFSVQQASCCLPALLCSNTVGAFPSELLRRPLHAHAYSLFQGCGD